MLIGYLQHQNGTPLEYEFGDIKHDKDTSFGKQFFTNKSGKFVVTGLAPGEYTLSFYNANLAKIKINVPENSDSIVRLKEIKVPQNE
jgi:outer membrane usher protein